MKTQFEKGKARWWLLLAAITVVIAVGLILATTTSADNAFDRLELVTICHVQPGQTGSPQTMTIYWSALDKCLSHFNDTIGPCTVINRWPGR